MPPTLHVCPFCPLYCDDIALEQPSQGNWMAKVQCGKAITAYAHTLPNSQSARIAETAVATALAIKKAKEMFAGKGIIHVATAGTDLDTARRLNRLQSDNRIRVAIDDTVSTAAWRAAVSREGTLSATLGDVRMHADVVWTIGDVENETPRWRERIAAETKQWIHSQSLAAEPLAELFQALRSNANGNESDQPIAKSIRSANYLAVILGRNALVESEAMATAEMLSKMLWYLNKTTRAIVLQWDPAATNRAVTAWQTNAPIDSVRQDPHAEIHIRLGSPSEGAKAATLQIGGIDLGPQFAELFLPAATLGIDREGVTIRGDGTVTLPLTAAHPSTDATSIEHLEQLLA